jgi:PAS domain S-box-containing protein
MTTDSQADFQQQFEQLVASIDGIVWQADARSFQFTFVSQQAERILGYPLEQWFAPGFWVDHLHPEDRAWAVEFCLQATRQQRNHDFEYRMIAADGRAIWLRDIVSVVVEEGEATKLRGIMVDVTAQKLAEQKQREGEEIYRLFAENTHDTITLFDLEGRRVYATPSLRRLLGRAPAATIDLAVEHIHPEDREMIRRAWEEVSAGKERSQLTFRCQAADASWRWLEGFGTLVQYQGKPHVLGIYRDITDRKRAEEEHQAHLWFLKSMDQINRAIQGTDDLEQMMRDVLDVVLAVFGCDRTWLGYPCDPAAATWCAAMERTHPEYPGAFALGVEIPVDTDVAKTLQTLKSASGPVRFGPAAEHPLPEAIANHFHVQSQLAMVVYPKIEPAYAFGLHQCSYPRVWTLEEERLFQEIGRRLADALTSLLMLRRLRENESKLEEAQRVAHVGYWDLDVETERLNWSDETYRIFGLQPQDPVMTKARLLERIHAEDRSRVAQAIALALQGGPRYDVEYHIVRPNGEVRMVHSQGDVTRDGAGCPHRMFGAVQDITERRQAEDRLRASEARFRTFVDHATDAFLLHDERGTILDANRQACESLGYSRDELIGTAPYEFDVDIDRTILDGLRVRLDAGEMITFDTHHRRKDGSVFPVEVRIRPFQEGRHRYAVSLARDMSERKRAEEALQVNHNLLSAVFEATPDVLYVKDLEGRVLAINSAGVRLLGRSRDEILGRDDTALLPPEAAQAIMRDDRRIITSGRAETFEEHVTIAGTTRTYLTTKDVYWDAQGNVVGLIGISRDMTERQWIEQALRESEELYRLLTENSNDLIYLVDLKGTIVYASPSVGRLLGQVPRSKFEVLHPDDVEAGQAYWERILGGDEGLLTVRVHDAGGTWHWLEAWSSLLSYHGQPHVLSVCRDVTERKQAEEALRNMERQLRTLVENIPDFIARFDPECRRLYVSPSVTKAFGLPLEHFVGKSLQDLAMPGPSGQNEALQARIRQVVGEGLPNITEAHWPTAQGQRVFEVRHIPERDESGRVVSVLAISRDVTERKRAEEALRRSEAYLAEAQRLSHAGSWAWSVASRQFVHWSQEHYRLHGLDLQRGIPSWEESQQFIHPDDRARCLGSIEKAIQARTDCELEYRTVLRDGTLRYIHSIAHPVFDAAGKLVEFVGTEMDITERKRAEAALRESEQRYREVFNCSSECIFLIDVMPEGRFQFAAFNPTEERTVGYTTADVAGRFIEDVIPAQLAAAVLTNYRRCVEAGTLISYDEELDLPIGRKSFHTNLVPVRDESGRIYRIIGVAREVTDQRRAEEALRRSEETLRRAQGIGHVGSWVYEVQDGVILGSEEGYRICGWGPGPHHAEELLALVHPDDLPLMQTAWQATLAGAPNQIEHRLMVDGKVRWVDLRAEPETDAEGRVVRITGVTQDITDRKRNEEALRASLREKEVLPKEVHHRVKNNLQLISSLLALQAGQLKDRTAAEAFRESQNRVRAMALVHENLYRSGDLASIRLAGHFESLCAYLFRSYNVDPTRIALDLRVAEVSLDLDRSIRLGLLVNELVSNVLKHAFPGGRSGRVLVQLNRASEGGYLFVVSDNGVSLPPHLAPGHSDTLGLQLVADLTEQLGGTLVLDRAGGTTFSIRFEDKPEGFSVSSP